MKRMLNVLTGHMVSAQASTFLQARDVHVNYIPGSRRYNLYEGEEPFGNVKVESSIFPVKKLIITWDAITLDRLNTEQS